MNLRMLQKLAGHAMDFSTFSISFVFAISIGFPKTSYGQTAACGQFAKCVSCMSWSLVKNIQLLL